MVKLVPGRASGFEAAAHEVRLSTDADAQAVQRIYAKCISSAEWLPAAAREDLDFAHASIGEVIHVAAASDGEVVGFVSVQPAESYIHHLFVHPEARGQGVGRQLLQSLLNWLPSPWRLKCVRANQRALAFYRSSGWSEVGSGVSEHGPYALLEWQREVLENESAQ